MASQLSKNFLDILGKQYLTDGWTNVTPRILDLMTRRLYESKDNPLYLISERIRHYFKESGQHQASIGPVGNNKIVKYDEFQYYSPIVTTNDNFDSLLIPKDHVSRRKADSYYVNSDNLFRSHTSAHQMHCLEKGSKAFISIADCYRRDEIDRSHFPVFHQCEVFKLYNHNEIFGSRNYQQAGQLYDKSSNETDTKQGVYSQEASSYVENMLKSCIEAFVKDLFDDQSLKTRWVSAYFPFTHPSFELEIFWREKWLEVLGCGVVRNEILRNAGIQDHIGFAAGFGLERFAMLKYAIPDIRLFWSKDTGFLHQFENKTPFDTVKFKQFSSCPQCINDVSFWLPQVESDSEDHGYNSNDFYDLCRTVAGDLVEQVKLVDEFTHPKTKRTSHCYRIVYRAADRVLTKEEVNVIHGKIAESSREQFQVELR